MAPRPRPSRHPLATLVGGVLALGLVLLILKWVAITAAILAVPYGIWWVVDRTRRSRAGHAAGRAAAALAARRAEVESRAVVDAAGGCGWCGSRIAHRDDRTGRLVAPREFHRVDIEEAIGTGARPP